MFLPGVSLAVDLKESPGAFVNLLHPGMVETDLNRKFGAKAGQGSTISQDESVAGIIARIDQMSAENSGQFFHAVSGEVLPW